MSKHLLDLISDLQQEVNEGRKAVEQKEHLLALLLERVSVPAISGGRAAQPDVNGIIQLNELAISKGSGKRTLTDDVRDVVSRFGSQEFNVVHVHAVLDKHGIEITGKAPRARISTALGELTEQRIIEKTFKGKGNVPNRYKLVPAAETFM